MAVAVSGFAPEPVLLVGRSDPARTTRAMAAQALGPIRLDYDMVHSLRTPGAWQVASQTQEQRLESLRRTSQVDDDPTTLHDQTRCGAACLVAGMFYQGGKQGVADTIDAMHDFAREHNLDVGPEVKPSRGGELTERDLGQVTESLHCLLQRQQERKDGYHGEDVKYDVLRDFVEQSPQVRKAFDEQGMDLLMVDANGQQNAFGGRVGNHYVLGFRHQGQATIYDPYPLPDHQHPGLQNQITQDPAVVARYLEARSVPDCSLYVYDGGANL